MIAVPESLVHLLKPWADFYSHSKTTETIVTFVHVGALVLGGGAAVATDRATFRAVRGGTEHRGHHLRELALAHPFVLTGLALALVSGLLLLAADIETFFGSWIFWLKMGLIVVLLANGVFMTRAEKSLAADAGVEARGWTSLHRTAVWSVVLWFAITLAGVALVNVS